MEGKLFAAEDDTLEQEDVVFAIDLRLGHNENIFEQEFTKVRDMVALPVLDPAFEVSDGLHILSSSLSFVDLVCDALSGCAPLLEFVVIWIVGGRCSFQKRLTVEQLVSDPMKGPVTYLK